LTVLAARIHALTGGGTVLASPCLAGSSPRWIVCAVHDTEVMMGRLTHEIGCENCGRQERGMSPTLDGWLLCPYCQEARADMPQRRTLQRLFRIRPRRSADGTVIFERYE
jgi:hypothetical protein